jgi:putative methyltransferase
VTYSTCSIHREENENVVETILRECPDWTLGNALPAWPRRGMVTAFDKASMTVLLYCLLINPFPDPGSLSPILAGKLVRTDPALDNTTGFFVALFVRKSEEDAKETKSAKKRKRQKAEEVYQNEAENQEDKFDANNSVVESESEVNVKNEELKEEESNKSEEKIKQKVKNNGKRRKVQFLVSK